MSVAGALRGLSAHLVASAVVLVAAVVATVTFYGFWFVVAVFANQPLGSPVQVVLATIVAVVLSLFLLATNWIPSTVIAARCSLHPIVRIPIAMGVSLVFSIVAGAIFLGADFFRAGAWTLALFAWLPLGLYLWAHFSSAMLLEALARHTGRAKP